VATLAGVSITTVSHVVNGTRYVAPDTRERVRHALEALNYEQPAPIVAKDWTSNPPPISTKPMAITAPVP